MGSFFRRLFAQLGMTGLIIVLAALAFGILAGGIVAHRLEASPTASQEEQQSETSDQKDTKDNGKPKGHGYGHTKPHPAEASDARENDQEND